MAFWPHSSKTLPGFINQLGTSPVVNSAPWLEERETYCGSTLRLNAFITLIVSGPSSSKRQC